MHFRARPAPDGDDRRMLYEKQNTRGIFIFQNLLMPEKLPVPCGLVFHHAQVKTMERGLWRGNCGRGVHRTARLRAPATRRPGRAVATLPLEDGEIFARLLITVRDA